MWYVYIDCIYIYIYVYIYIYIYILPDSKTSLFKLFEIIGCKTQSQQNPSATELGCKAQSYVNICLEARAQRAYAFRITFTMGTVAKRNVVWPLV